MHKTKILFEEEGMPGFLSMFLFCLDQLLILKLKGSSDHNCCENSYLYLNCKEEKELKTSTSIDPASYLYFSWRPQIQIQ